MLNIKDISIDNIDKKLITMNYKVLNNPKASKTRKKIAIEFMSRFASIDPHENYLRILMEKEQDQELIELFRRALSGEKLYIKYNYLNELFEDGVRDFNSEWNENLSKAKLKDLQEISNEIKWRKH